MSTALATRLTAAAATLKRPFPAPIPVLLLVLLVLFYIFIPGWVEGRAFHAPAIALDAMVPLIPLWSVVYGCLYAFLILLPLLIVREPEHVRSTAYTYLAVWTISYAFFVAYPTVAPRPEEVTGGGFGAWGLRALYSADPPFNCFPSLHVAHSWISALAAFRVHRGVGTVALASAVLVALSTLFTKQHYIADVIAGALLATAAYLLFARRLRQRVEDDTAAPDVAVGLLAFVSAIAVGFWVAYQAGF